MLMANVLEAENFPITLWYSAAMVSKKVNFSYVVCKYNSLFYFLIHVKVKVQLSLYLIKHHTMRMYEGAEV
jgi:hypothetical protein